MRCASRTILLLLTLSILLPTSLAATIPINVSSLGNTYIEWSWPYGYDLTTITIDGIEICGYETTYNKSLQTGYEPASLHTIYITDGTDSGSASAYTTSDSADNATGTFPWCNQQDIFFWNASSDLTGYEVMDHVPQPAPQTSITTPSFTVASGEVNVGTWATPVGSPGKVLAPGLWQFRAYAYSSTTAGSTRLKFYAINRSATGVETPLFFGQAITHDIDATGIPEEHVISYARRNYTAINPGDRLLIRVNASTDSASARTLTYEMGGNTNASMVSVGYFLCPTAADSALDEDYTSDATAAAFGIVGGLVTSVLILKRRKDIDIRREE